MLNIEKGAQPKELIAFKKTPGASYSGLGGNVSRKLKLALLEEQGYLCCYCMRRIDLDSMKVEHWHPRSRFPREELNYTNLLAACNGVIAASDAKSEQCCDTRKADSLLKYNPANSAHNVEARLVYQGDGSISAPDDKAFSEQLGKSEQQGKSKRDPKNILNLNLAALRNDRKTSLLLCRTYWEQERVCGHVVRFVLNSNVCANLTRMAGWRSMPV